MWELAPKFNARIVFVEHRYEGKSLPTNISKDCLSYASTIQAVADYAKILEDKINPGNKSPVIVFGGSYGGMLSAWMVSNELYTHLLLLLLLLFLLL
jgi:lysosomal Pro-X carboxypeptidase